MAFLGQISLVNISKYSKTITKRPKDTPEHRKKILRISFMKLQMIEDPEIVLRRSVLINNTFRNLQMMQHREMSRGEAFMTNATVTVERIETSDSERTVSGEKTGLEECDRNKATSNVEVREPLDWAEISKGEQRIWETINDSKKSMSDNEGDDDADSSCSDEGYDEDSMSDSEDEDDRTGCVDCVRQYKSDSDEQENSQEPNSFSEEVHGRKFSKSIDYGPRDKSSEYFDRNNATHIPIVT